MLLNFTKFKNQNSIVVAVFFQAIISIRNRGRYCIHQVFNLIRFDFSMQILFIPWKNYELYLNFWAPIIKCVLRWFAILRALFCTNFVQRCFSQLCRTQMLEKIVIDLLPNRLCWIGIPIVSAHFNVFRTKFIGSAPIEFVSAWEWHAWHFVCFWDIEKQIHFISKYFDQTYAMVTALVRYQKFIKF